MKNSKNRAYPHNLAIEKEQQQKRKIEISLFNNILTNTSNTKANQAQ